jgi:hypothetical protein
VFNFAILVMATCLCVGGFIAGLCVEHRWWLKAVRGRARLKIGDDEFVVVEAGFFRHVYEEPIMRMRDAAISKQHSDT